MNFTNNANIRQTLLRLLCAVGISCAVIALATAQDIPAAADGVSNDGSGLARELFRTESTRIEGGAELITIFERKDTPDGDLPLVSVLRDDLGDDRPENDRLRYIWLHTYTRPSLAQKLSALVPFLYFRTTNKGDVGKSPPPPIADLNAPSGAGGWDPVFWEVFRRALTIDPVRFAKTSILQYRQNKEDYKRTAIATTLAVLSIYEGAGGERALTQQELHDIQARLSIKDELLGGHMQPENLGRAYDRNLEKVRDQRAQNWELLRQTSERQGLVFEPLLMPDGTARHAILWVAQEDALKNRGRKWNGRFLNIKNPWADAKILSWKGYRETRWYDSEDREVAEGTPDAIKRTLVPLAIYGLENPKIPTILVDFRSNANPKMREMSKRALDDVLNGFVSVSIFGDLPLFLGKYAYDYVTAKRGIDIDQPSRLRSYAQLKLLLQLSDPLNESLEGEVSKRLESATLNPLQNDSVVEERLARAQYANLMAWAGTHTGLEKTLANDRREELVRVKHPGFGTRMGFNLAHVFTFGAYTHRETSTPDLMAKMDLKRRLDYHERYVREVAYRTNDPEIDSNSEKLKHSLAFLSQDGSDAGGKTVRAIAKIFSAAQDDDTRSLCLAGLYKINSEGAKRELLAIYRNNQVTPHWRETSARYLKLALDEGQRISKNDVRMITGITSLE